MSSFYPGFGYVSAGAEVKPGDTLPRERRWDVRERRKCDHPRSICTHAIHAIHSCCCVMRPVPRSARLRPVLRREDRLDGFTEQRGDPERELQARRVLPGLDRVDGALHLLGADGVEHGLEPSAANLSKQPFGDLQNVRVVL